MSTDKIVEDMMAQAGSIQESSMHGVDESIMNEIGMHGVDESTQMYGLAGAPMGTHPSPATGDTNVPTPLSTDDAKRAAILRILSSSTEVDGNYILNVVKFHRLAPIGPSTFRRLMAAMEIEGHVEERGHGLWVITPAGLAWLNGHFQKANG